MQRIPIILLTGFLGSGKTTLLRRLLADPALADTAVLINEIGEVGLDHLLVYGEGARALGDSGAALRAALLLANGCVCCTVTGDLARALDDLLVRRAAGEIAAFERVIIETTGLADPVPLIEALQGSPLAAARYALVQVLCTVDAVAGAARWSSQREALAQIVTADHLLITRTDLVDAAVVDDLARQLARLNPRAHITPVAQGAIDPEQLFALTGLPAAVVPRPRSPAPGAAVRPDPIASRGPIRPLFHADVSTSTVRFSGPAVWSQALTMIEQACADAADEVLRVKGVLRLDGYEHPMLVQYAGGRISPVEPLPAALAEGDAGFLVFIRRARPPQRDA